MAREYLIRNPDLSHRSLPSSKPVSVFVHPVVFKAPLIGAIALSTAHPKGRVFMSAKGQIWRVAKYDAASKSNIVKIVDAKAWREGTENPRGKVLHYKLYDGAHYYPDSGGWSQPQPTKNSQAKK